VSYVFTPAARGEFNFQIADQAHVDGILSDDDYAGVVWALLVVTLLTPLWFRVSFQGSPPASGNDGIGTATATGASPASGTLSTIVWTTGEP
jgi:hypothetical protein